MTVVSLLGISIPVFVLGLTLQYIFAVQLDLLPAAGRIDPRANLEIKSELRAHRQPADGPAWTCSSTACRT